MLTSCISYETNNHYDIQTRLFYNSISLKEESTKLCFLFDFSWLVLLHGEFQFSWKQEETVPRLHSETSLI